MDSAELPARLSSSFAAVRHHARGDRGHALQAAQNVSFQVWSRRALTWAGSLLLIAGCSAAPPPPHPAVQLFAPEPGPSPAAANQANDGLDGGAVDGRDEASIAQPESAPCVEAAPPAPACESDALRVGEDLTFNPQYAQPPASIRAELDRVANAMHEHPKWQLLRVEVYSGVDPGGNTLLTRREMDQSQRRADAILGYLYHRRKVSAERLDAVGYGFVQGVSASQSDAKSGLRWRVVLRLVQRLK